ncbi:MAG: hypothetical protein WD397_09375 [Wenzhouxiangellaceae bacterium]
MKPPLLIQVDLLGNAGDPAKARWLPLLSELKQVERPLVLLAERPDRWTPTRNRVDKAFMRQATIESEIRRAGGALDAVIYLDLGLFARKRQFDRNMADLADRYDCAAERIDAILRPGRIADALEGIIGSVERVDNDDQFKAVLESAVRASQR